MEAPVPASALIHSATLVSAGIFLIIRVYPVFENSKNLLILIMILGAITALFGGLISMNQSDSKKILAYSTISHCGFLMLSTSFNVLEFTITYLYIHGFFKALTFMAIGNVNRFNKGRQDFRTMGVFYKYLKFETFISFVGLFNLAGLPFSLGFFMKHLIFITLLYNSILSYFIFINIFLGAITGIFYCGRLFIFIFFDFKKGLKSTYNFSYFKIANNRLFSYSTPASFVALCFLLLFSYYFSLKILFFFISDFYN